MIVKKTKGFAVPFFTYGDFIKHLVVCQSEIEGGRYDGIKKMTYEEKDLIVFVGINIELTGQPKQIDLLFEELEKRN